VRVGRTVGVSGHRNRDGSLAASRIRVGARHRRARLRGTVTFVNRSAHRFTVSSAAGSISVRGGRSGAARAADDDLPPVGQRVVVTITVSAGGVLEEDGVDDMGMDEGEVEIEIEGIVQAVDPNADTVTTWFRGGGARHLPPLIVALVARGLPSTG
jgi:hypothetical protein